MNFDQIFLNLLLSTFGGIAGGLIVYWTFSGIHFLDKGFKPKINKFSERYVWKFGLILCLLIIMALLFSIFYWVFEIGIIAYPELIFLISLNCLIVIILTLLSSRFY